MLFTDGEENGFHGSQLFVDEHRWARDIGVVLNFDARGNSGPSFMFETSDENGWLVEQFAQAVPHPLATSLSMDVYRIMPNNTDMTVFKHAGMGGLNFAFSAGIAYYHSLEDRPENLDLSTLQHQGENALAMSRRLGALDLDKVRRRDVVYTSVLGRTVLYYDQAWGLPLAVVATGLFLVVVRAAIRTGIMRMGDLMVGAGITLAAICAALLSAVILFLLGAFWSVLRDRVGGLYIPWQKYDVSIMTGCALGTAAMTLMLERWLGRDRPLVALGLGALTWWLVLSLATAVWLPGASYLFVWPTLTGLVGLAVSVHSRPGSIIAWSTTMLCSTPSLILLPPLIRATFDGLGLGMMAPIMVVVALFIGSILPLFGPLVLPEAAYSERSAYTQGQGACHGG